MMSQLLARRGIYRASASSQLASRRSRPCQLVIRAYLPDEGAKKVVKKVVKPTTVKSKVTFQVPRHVEYGQDVCLIGEDPVLGEWDVTKCVPMAWHEGDVWTAEADLPHGATIEYKYVVRAAEDMGGDVLDWVPSWNLALDLSEKELTVRDCWEGESHEVLQGTLPLPVPTPAPTAASSPQEGATDKVTEVVTAVAEAAATAAAAAVLEAMVDAPSSTAAAAVAAPSVTAVVPPAAAAPLAAAAAASDIEDDPVPAEQLAGVADTAAAAAAAEGYSSDSDFRSGSESDDVLTVEDIAAAAPAAPAAAHSPLPPAAPASPSRRRNSTEGKGFKAIGTKIAVAAAAAPKLGDWSGMATSELKQLCKERGLSVKGARRDLVARLQQHAA